MYATAAFYTRTASVYYTRVPCTRVYSILHAWYTHVQHTTRVVHSCTAYYTRGTRVYSILHAWYTRVQHTTRVYTHGVMPRVLLCKLCACVTRVFCVSHACLLRVARVSSACHTRGLFKLWVICTVCHKVSWLFDNSS